jgi:uncharacterized membrane protein YeaQ/YmgE (transglycosylase-associated protein family)
MPLSPTLTFSLLLATFYGALAHLILNGGGRQLVVFVIAAWIGFAIGQEAGDVMGITILAIGPTNIVPASLGALVAVATAAILAYRRTSSHTPQ